MLRRNIVIINKLGLHARAAVKFVNTAKKFASSVHIVKEGHEVDGKSILGILTMAAVQGTEIELKIDGPDEKATLKALVALIEDKFHEEE